MQQTIFDDSFNQVPPIRRRDVMPLALKIYIWVGMVISGLIFLNATLRFQSFRQLMNNGKEPATVFMLPLILILVNVLLIFLMTFLLWMEVKWAIKFNWAVGSIWLCGMVSACISLETMAGGLLFFLC